MKILLTIEYKGTDFAGWQIQPNKRTVQGEIEAAFSTIMQKQVPIFASGRTDAGVHALAQTAHFEIDSNTLLQKFGRNKFDKEKFLSAINANLPMDIRINSAKIVKDNFHARFDVKEKIYLYKLQIGYASPFSNGLVGVFKKNLDIERMKQASEYLVGAHDFTSFSSAKTGVKNFVRTINYIKIKKKVDIITFEISGSGFLYNMVRIIVGTLADVGIYKIKPEDVRTILESKDRKKAGKTVQACGLYLKKVRY